MTSIINTIREIVRREMREIRISELGLVEQVYPHSTDSDNDNYGCDVRLKNSGLLLKRVPLTTDRIGTAAIPNIGDLVLLTFDKGDINQPVIIGRLYNDEDRPPLNNPDEIIFRLPLAEADDKTIKSAIRNIAGNSPPREALLEMPPKITLQINDGTVHAVAGKSEMKLDQTNESGGTVTALAGRTKITMNQDGDLTIEAAGSLTLKAQSDISLEGNNIAIKGRMQAKMEAGTSLDIKAGTGATINGGVSATVQGISVSVKGMTSFSP